MRWYAPVPSVSGDHRTITRFLWFPKTINRETRWLERASWVEAYHLSYPYGCYWSPVGWCTEVSP